MSLDSRHRVGLLVSLSLVVSLIALPASALTTEACPSMIPGGDFTDLAGLSVDVVDAIDCVGYYRIARGIGPGLYGPGDSVTRWQMALFLSRTALQLGLYANGVNQGFVDIGDLSGEAQIAINRLSQLGITTGTGPKVFSPHDTVTRWQMALFLTRLHGKAGFKLPSGTSQGFTDIGAYSSDMQTAINQLVEMGLATGTAPGQYDPGASVSRWQMALFLARELELGQTAPYKVYLSYYALTPGIREVKALVVPVNDIGSPPGLVVDFFVGSINSDGSCAPNPSIGLNGTDNADGGTGINCTIDSSDPTTSDFGGARVRYLPEGLRDEDVFVAWLGEPGEIFNRNRVRTMAIFPMTSLLSSGRAPSQAGMVEHDVVEFSNPVGNSVFVKRLTGTVDYYILEFDMNDTFIVDGQVKSFSEFAAALADLALPDYDGAGGTSLVTNPYTTTWADASTFVLTP